MKNTLERINRIDGVEDRISELEDKVTENTQSEEQKEKSIKKMRKPTGYLPQRLENPYPKRYLHTNIHSSIIHSGQTMEATKVFCDR